MAIKVLLLRIEHQYGCLVHLYCTVKLQMKHKIVLENVQIMTDIIMCQNSQKSLSYGTDRILYNYLEILYLMYIPLVIAHDLLISPNSIKQIQFQTFNFQKRRYNSTSCRNLLN